MSEEAYVHGLQMEMYQSKVHRERRDNPHAVMEEQLLVQEVVITPPDEGGEGGE